MKIMPARIKHTMMSLATLALLGGCVAINATSSPETRSQSRINESVTNMIVKKASPYSAGQTIDRLENVLKAKGLTVFTRVNHAAGAQKVGLDMTDSELIIFGNPKLGTPLMLENPAMGLDLPLKALAYTDGSGQTYLTYTAPVSLQSRHNITAQSAIIEKMTGALDAMTSKAVSQE